MILLAIFFPGVYFLVRGKFISAFFAIVFQVVAGFTFLLLGLGFFIWVALAMWAGLSHSHYKAEKRLRMAEQRIQAQQAALM